MIPNLREKLKMMTSSCPLNSVNIDGKNTNNKNIDAESIATKAKSEIPMDTMGGEVIKSEWGKHVVKRSVYPINSVYGNVSLGDITKADFKNLSVVTKMEGLLFDIKDILFFDTETTGLSGGSGTVAFLVGMGYYEKDNFIIEQHMMRDFDEELSMLHGVLDVISQKKVIASFNGKSFDWPLLESRFIFNKIPAPKLRGRHMDILHPLRSVCKYSLESCRLTSLEEFLIEFNRTDDIPGSEIPNIYFKYLQDRDISQMIKVIDHNNMDIKALCALTVILDKLMAELDNETLEENILFGMARLLHNRGIMDKAKLCYIQFINRGINIKRIYEAKKQLAYIYKAEKNYSRAVVLWESMAGGRGNLNILPHIELAKYYEHVDGNLCSALFYTDSAIEILQKRYNTGDCLIKEVLHRRKRLLKKLERNEVECL